MSCELDKHHGDKIGRQNKYFPELSHLCTAWAYPCVNVKKICPHCLQISRPANDFGGSLKLLELIDSFSNFVVDTCPFGCDCKRTSCSKKCLFHRLYNMPNYTVRRWRRPHFPRLIKRQKEGIVTLDRRQRERSIWSTNA